MDGWEIQEEVEKINLYSVPSVDKTLRWLLCLLQPYCRLKKSRVIISPRRWVQDSNPGPLASKADAYYSLTQAHIQIPGSADCEKLEILVTATEPGQFQRDLADSNCTQGCLSHLRNRRKSQWSPEKKESCWSLGHLGTRLELGGKCFYDTRLSKTGEVFKKGTTVHRDGCDHNLFSWSPAKPMTLGHLQLGRN